MLFKTGNNLTLTGSDLPITGITLHTTGSDLSNIGIDLHAVGQDLTEADIDLSKPWIIQECPQIDIHFRSWFGRMDKSDGK